MTPPSVDGRLGDEVWTLAPVATGFMQRDPDNGQSMTRQTRIQVAYDDRFLYVAVTCLAAAIVTTQSAVPLQVPDQPVKSVP